MSKVLNKVLDLLASEPVLFVGVIDASIALLVSLGFNVPKETAVAIDGLVVAVSLLYVRSKVTPTLA